MDIYVSPEEVIPPIRTNTYDSSNLHFLPGEEYRPESMSLCLLPAGTSSPEGMILCEFPEPHSARSTDVMFLPAEAYVPDNLNLCLLPAEKYEIESADQYLLPAKTYEAESADQHPLPAKPYESEIADLFLLTANAYSPNSLSDYGCHVTPPAEDPNAHSSAWVRSVGPEEIAEYQNLAECNPLSVDIDIEMANLMHDFMPMSLPSIAETPDRSPGSDESSIRALLSPELCSPIFSNTPLDIETHQSLIPVALNLPIKRGPENQPTLFNPGAFKRPRSEVASLRSVNSTQGAKRISATRSIASRLSISRKSNISLLNGIDELNESARNSTAKAESPNRKKLFGSDGWLGPHPGSVSGSSIFEPPPMLPLKSISKPTLFRNFSKKFKKQVNNHEPKSPSKAFTSNFMKSHSNSFKSSLIGTLKTNLQVSLDPSCQAKLYADLEVMICTSANDFLLRQYYDGRISQYSVNKVLQQWESKNRPQVYQFHFDQTTQRELILENRRTLDLNGGCSTNVMQFHSSMQSWKAIATEMSARTFCLPDNAIRKNLFEIQQILDMLSAPVSTLRELNDLCSWAQSQMFEASELSRSSTQSQSR